MRIGKGWRNEPLRHSLARKGVKTGRAKSKDYVMVRSILGTEIWRNKKTGKEYLADYDDKGKPHLKEMNEEEQEEMFDKIKEKKRNQINKEYKKIKRKKDLQFFFFGTK